jgi:hypothetical protein
MELADDIKKDWWEKNKDEFLKGLEIENNNWYQYNFFNFNLKK